MIVGIGVDIICIARMVKILERHNQHFAKRILTEREMLVYEKAPNPAAFLAKRFAAKEAAAKALGTGIGKVSFRHIEVSNNSLGAPILTLLGYAAELQQTLAITRCHLSITDETDHAVAFVVLESDG